MKRQPNWDWSDWLLNCYTDYIVIALCSHIIHCSRVLLSYSPALLVSYSLFSLSLSFLSLSSSLFSSLLLIFSLLFSLLFSSSQHQSQHTLLLVLTYLLRYSTIPRSTLILPYTSCSIVFSCIFTSFGLFLCSVPGFGQIQTSRSRKHSVHLGLLSQHRFLRCRHVRHPIRSRLATFCNLDPLRGRELGSESTESSSDEWFSSSSRLVLECAFWARGASLTPGSIFSHWSPWKLPCLGSGGTMWYGCKGNCMWGSWPGCPGGPTALFRPSENGACAFWTPGRCCRCSCEDCCPGKWSLKSGGRFGWSMDVEPWEGEL